MCFCLGRLVASRYMSTAKKPPPSQSGRVKDTPLKTSLSKPPKSKATSKVSALLIFGLLTQFMEN